MQMAQSGSTLWPPAPRGLLSHECMTSRSQDARPYGRVFCFQGRPSKTSSVEGGCLPLPSLAPVEQGTWAVPLRQSNATFPMKESQKEGQEANCRA